jgi:DTW domain-containing protein YfiP
VRSSTPVDLRGHCPRCFLRTSHCLCAELPTLTTPCQFVILRHIKEAWRTSNTARLAALALPGTQIVSYGSPGPTLALGALSQSDSWLLFPGISAPGIPAAGERIVVLDGSWRQARRMLHRLPGLQNLRRLSLPADSGVMRLRRPTVPSGMSTLEAIAGAVGLVQGQEAANALQKLYRSLVDRSRQLRGLSRPVPQPQIA